MSYIVFPVARRHFGSTAKFRVHSAVYRQAACFWVIHSPARASPYINITELASSDASADGRSREEEQGGCPGRVLNLRRHAINRKVIYA
jgi:hypothetical protein